jgi:hypothetical protein
VSDNVRRFPGGLPPEYAFDPLLSPYEQGRIHGTQSLLQPSEPPANVRDEIARRQRDHERTHVQNELLHLVSVFAQGGRNAENATAEARKAFDITRAAALELVPEYKP